MIFYFSNQDLRFLLTNLRKMSSSQASDFSVSLLNRELEAIAVNYTEICSWH